MAPSTPTSSQGFSRRGIIAGYVWRLVREHLGFTQAALAEVLGVSLDTIAGWETGRRPLTALSAGQMVTYRHRLLYLGANPGLFVALDRALEADVLLTEILELPLGDARMHPLGAWVMQRPLLETVAWPLTGISPSPLREVAQRRRRGPVPPGPELSTEDQQRLFSNLRHVAENARDSEFLLRRQAVYLAGYDASPDSAEWLADQQAAVRPDTWLTRWLHARSVASVATRYGDTDRLVHFIDSTLVDDDRGETANLNYWAYWVGETRLEVSDDFMVDRLGTWDGRLLLDHFLSRLDSGHGYLELYIHTVWSLLSTRPHLLRSSTVTRALKDRLGVLLDSPGLSQRARRELDDVRYAIRLSEA